jgi:NitT/TauT family transport system substrate-binding protein
MAGRELIAGQKIAVAVLLAAAIVAAGLLAVYSSASPPPGTVPAEPVTIGTAPLEVSGLIFIAEDQGYFQENGISPAIRIYPAGINAVDALFAGEVDVATAADFVFARQVLAGKPVRGIATIGRSEFHYIVTEKDRGIRTAADLKGKKIGVARGTSGDFFLGRYLELNGIDLRDVEIVDVPPSEIAAPLLDGRVDAVSTWDPYAWSTEVQLGNRSLAWPEQKGQMMYWMAICRKDTVTGDPARVRKFLQSLQQAETFAANNPAEARRIVQKRLRTDDAYLERVWPATRLSLSLDQSLVTAMEDEARWMIANNRSGEPVPDFRTYIYPDSLEELRPGSVRIIG